MNFLHRALSLQEGLSSLPTEDLGFESFDSKEQHSVRVSKFLQEEIKNESFEFKQRILEEFEGFGPLAPLLSDEGITEIIVNGPQEIWFEVQGHLIRHNDCFVSEITFENIIEKICHESKVQFNLERPYCDGRFRNFRLHLVSKELTQNFHSITLRRQASSPWTLDKLADSKWSDPMGMSCLREIVDSHKNFLVVGETGSGKTSVLNSCLQSIPKNERVVVIEDTSEIALPNEISTKIVVRTDCNRILPDILLSDLVKQSLRMRPDRLVVGEVRGAEAKDLLMALSTGHHGSMGTLHANSAQQAILRLEMLVQLGAPDWSLQTIRRLLSLSLNSIVVVGKNLQGQRKLKSIHNIAGLEDSGLLLDTIFESVEPNEFS